MYESFFGFTDPPFSAVPATARYIPNPEMEEAKATLARCIERGTGPAAVIGPAGTGKTLLGLLIAEQFQGQMNVVRLDCGRISSRRALLQSILHGLRLPFRGMGEGELRLSLIDHLGGAQTSAEGVLLFVDEAHTLPLRVLEEVRLLSNLTADGKSRIRAVLLGCTLLEERLALGRMELFSQRLSARCYLTALGRDETREYVYGRIARSGGTPANCLTEDALKAVYDATDGIPRLINQLCEHAFLLAFAGDQRIIEDWGIREAWADLQRLPAPDDPRGSDHDGERRLGIVEFGDLDDESSSREFVARGNSPFREGRYEQGGFSPDAFDDSGDDFVPAATIGPRTELVFDDFRDPFDEPFDREEVIIDRCARLQARLAREFSPGAVLESPRNVALDGADFAGRSTKQGWAASDGDAIRVLDEPRYSSAGAASLDRAGEADLIIVLNENHPAEAETPARPIAVAQRAEFRDLFARLRHG